MLIDLVRENATQRDTDYHDTIAGIVLAREWLRSNSSNVKQFDETRISKRGRDNEGRPNEIDSYRSIANFLQTNGGTPDYLLLFH